jgi:hypothetical protein
MSAALTVLHQTLGAAQKFNTHNCVAVTSLLCFLSINPCGHFTTKRTNPDLEKFSRAIIKRFERGLFYDLNVVTIAIVATY